MMFKRALWSCLFTIILTVIPSNGVMACSGYPYFGVDDLPNMDLLVKATVVDVDDRGFNAVMRVESYYKGTGDLFVTIMRYPQALETGARTRGYDTGCLYSGQGTRLLLGDQGYFGLRSNGDGTYTDYYGGTAHFFPVDGKITYQEGVTEGYRVEFDEPLTITEAEFIEKLLEAGERDEPFVPAQDAEVVRFPLMRFLNIWTEDGTRYQVNPDRTILELPSDGPIAISPDGSHVVFRVDDNTIAFQYIWTHYRYTEDFLEWYKEMRGRDIELDSLMKPGEAVRFSSDSNLVAVWDQTHLAIYMLHNDGQSHNLMGNNGIRLSQVAYIKFPTTENGPLPNVLWSPDGSTLAWEGPDGIWHWNIYDQADPTQIMSPSQLIDLDISLPALMDLSTYGRYIRLGQSGEWVLIDSQTRQEYPNAVASPTEQFLFLVNEGSNVERAESQACTPPLRETCVKYLTTEDVQDIFQYQQNLVGVVSCDRESSWCIVETTSWHPAIGPTSYINRISAIISDLRQIVYDPQYRRSAILVGDYRIYFDFYSDYAVNEPDYLPYLDLLDLEKLIDSPITHIEWGQPVFYDEYHLTTAQFLFR